MEAEFMQAVKRVFGLETIDCSVDWKSNLYGIQLGIDCERFSDAQQLHQHLGLSSRAHAMGVYFICLRCRGEKAFAFSPDYVLRVYKPKPDNN